jgi:anti-sigma B factor antagonist
MALRITIREAGDVTILDLDGRIVLGEESNTLKLEIKKILDQKKRKIIINFGDVTFIDSSGNGAVVSAHLTARTRGADLKFCHLGKGLQDLWQINRLLTVFDIYDTEANALRAFASFGAPRLYCRCPLCAQQTAPSLLRGSQWAPQSCSNAACGAHFSIEYSPRPHELASIKELCFETYENESFIVRPGVPFICQIVGRLDLFSSSALQKCWLTLPLPRRLVFDLHRATDRSEAGRAALTALLGNKDGGSKVTASLEGLHPSQVMAFPDSGPFYQRMADALKALGDISDTPLWRVPITEKP